MALKRTERLGTAPAQAWAASGAISAELSPRQGTITRLHLVVRADITTTTATNYNDYWDRLISRLTLSRGGETIFDFSNMRAAYHFTRFHSPHLAPPRPTVIADSQTNALEQFHYVFHFGVAPLVFNPVSQTWQDNPFDLTGGIPPSTKGTLSLTGSFAAASAMGSNVTINDGDLYIYFDTVQPEAGDSELDYLPKAIPKWTMETPTPTATSTAFGTTYNVPAGSFLRASLVMLTNGTNAPRDNAVLNSFQVYDSIKAQSIIGYGGEAAAAADVQIAEMHSQAPFRSLRAPSDDNSTLGVPAITDNVDEGLIWLPLWLYGNPKKGADPLYGLPLQNVATGDLQFRYGVADATGITMDVVHQKYDRLI